MRPAASLRDIMEGLRSRPARTAISGVGVAAGAAILTAVLAVTTGVRHEVRRTLAGLGTHVFGLRAPSGADSRPCLQRRHAAALAANLPGSLVTALRVTDGAPATGWPGVSIVASDENIFKVRPWRIVAGRGLDPEDIRVGSRVAVASRSLARARGLRPGDSVRVGPVLFRLVGLVSLHAASLDMAAAAPPTGAEEQALFVPWTAFRPEPAPVAFTGAEVDQIFVRSADLDHFARDRERAARLFEQPDDRMKNLIWIIPDEVVSGLARFQRLVALAGGSVALLCLLLGGVALMTLLLADVRERIPEIGLRRALGASRADIGFLFLGEALLITGTAALIGTGVAVGALALAGESGPLPVAMSPAVVGLPVLACLGVGAVFSFAPAVRAAGILPAQALREA